VQLGGNIRNDNTVGAHKLSLLVRIKTLAATAFFGCLFFAVEKK
jgi:hypothetical protein